ncbi:succinylglutamate desuccinylase/aspartoacylase family protein [Microvirga sp. VF16]|uniref:M14 family zinc carboxypeptidase n=1 Tax=Microvirga sp. VF16 TaxID=2807101 RepID=UPI00193CF282|nr:succinylglutamate desuccinylase/aspartoacylase family protein [Microvirga sp. VF16]QRM32832.1 succinylglutamate desuccinylase/aspartoacylase family protein [Microvirga sp. VF16]
MMLSTVEHIPLSVSWVGTQREIVAYRFGAGRNGPKVYLQGGLHTEEPPGMLILHHLVQLLRDRDDEPRGEIIVVPCANPVGLAQMIQGYHAGRSDLGTGGNFNRNFPDISLLLGERLTQLKNSGGVVDRSTVKCAMREIVDQLVPKTEIDSLKQVLLGLAVDSDYVLDLHSDSEAGVYAFVSDHQHPAADILSRHIGSVVTVGGVNGGLTFKDSCFLPWQMVAEHLSDTSMTGCFAATIEYRGTRDVQDDIATDDALRLIAFMETVGVLTPRGVHELDFPVRNISRGCVDFVRANMPGLIIFSKAPGDQIAVGEEVAQILNPATGERNSVAARTSGIMFGRVASRIAVPGATIATIAGDSELPTEPGDPFP